ncbi:Na+/H+ antiporter NhaA [Salinifilum aidingensis]
MSGTGTEQNSTPGGGASLTSVLRSEPVGGALLLLAAVVAMVWVNTPWGETYEAVKSFVPLPQAEVIGLDLDIAHWTADGLLAIFFFVVGLELKREFVSGELRNPRRAALPIVAAVFGMVVPALIYFTITATGDPAATRGWAIPTATDIAFAVGVLAIVGSHLPGALRTFLLTLAVVDDLLAITVIALFYTEDFSPLLLLASLAPIALFCLLAQLRKTWWWALIPLAVIAWVLMHESGVHATIAGVLLGFTVPALTRGDEEHDLAERFEHTWRPISSGIAVPLFALFAAGVSLAGGGLSAALSEPVGIGIATGLVLGKVIGIAGSSFVLHTFTNAKLDPNLSWPDVFGVSLLAGIGFTVSLLIGELAFSAGDPRGDYVTISVLVASVTAAVLASIVLTIRSHVHKKAKQTA